MSKFSERPSIVMPTVAEDLAITAAAEADPDAQPMTSKQLQSMVPLKSVQGQPRPRKTLACVSAKNPAATEG